MYVSISLFPHLFSTSWKIQDRPLTCHVLGWMPRTERRKEGTLKSKVAKIFSLFLLLRRTEFGVKLSQAERPTCFRSVREKKRASEEKMRRERRKEERARREGIDIGNGGGYIFQNIGYLGGKPVVCILTDRPVYGAQFISKSKVMAAGLRPMVCFHPPSSLVLDHPRSQARPRRQLPAASTLKFQTNTKMPGSDPNMYCPVSPG